MVSYRNIRFNWHGNYKQTLLYFVLGPVISFFSLGFLQPLLQNFIILIMLIIIHMVHLDFQQIQQLNNIYRSFKSGFLPALIIFYSIIVYTIWDIANLIEWNFVYIDTIFNDYSNGFEILFFIMIPIIFITNFIYRIFARNMLLRATILSNSNNNEISANFGSTLNPATYLWIIITNAIIVPITLGLCPQGQIRFISVIVFDKNRNNW